MGTLGRVPRLGSGWVSPRGGDLVPLGPFWGADPSPDLALLLCSCCIPEPPGTSLLFKQVHNHLSLIVPLRTFIRSRGADAQGPATHMDGRRPSPRSAPALISPVFSSIPYHHNAREEFMHGEDGKLWEEDQAPGMPK